MSYRLADRAALRILSISRAIRGAKSAGVPQQPTIDELDPPEIAATRPAPVIDTTGAAPMDQSGADMPTLIQGGDMFTALANGRG